MIQLLIPIILVVLAVVLARRYINAAPAEDQKSRKINVLLIALTIGLLILTLLHRMHWLGAIAPALILLGRTLVKSFLTILNKKRNNSDSVDHHSKQHNKESRPESPSGSMNEAEALKILGLKEPYSREDVVEAHRRLMQKFHPDRGGNDYLAARINEAKEFLLNRI